MATMLALCGLPGSGKSTLARVLVQHTGWQHLDRDRLRIEMFAGGGYGDAEKSRLNFTLAKRAGQMLAMGDSVVVDGMTLARQHERDALRAVAVSESATWRLVWLDCPPELACQRVAADRNHPALDRNAEIVALVSARFEPPVDAIRLDATRPVSDLLQALLDALGYARKPFDVIPSRGNSV